MPLTTGARLGCYEITGALGAGGMGEVYRARDTQLNRDVAIKVLPELFAADKDRLARFNREAQTLASLNHPNIAQIYGIETADGVRALVMELVEGDDLSVRIARGPIPLDEALPIARQIAEALEAAHGAGIIHRDLKPANIKVRPDGSVKVLDFGLAKALNTEADGSADARQDPCPTFTSPAYTQMGVILGTAPYMAPEQARGHAVDRRADVWAFGAIVYEMLTGRRAFPGDETADVVAAVLRQPVDWTALPDHTPPSVRRLLRRCIERDRVERLADISAARLDIKEAIAGIPEGVSDAAPTTPSGRAWMFVSAGLAVLVAALAVALAMNPAPAPDAGALPLTRFELVANPAIRVNTSTTQPFATSPDGRVVVFGADDGSGLRLWVRTLDRPDPLPLADTEDGHQPAISPDGEWVAFVTANHIIRKTRLNGGGTTTIAKLNDLTAAIAWTSSDEILFEKIGSGSGIHRVNANGGSPELLIPLDAAAGERNQRRPFVLREQRVVLYASTTGVDRVTLAAFSLADGRRGRLEVEGLQALGLLDGNLLYARGDGALMAVPFDARRLTATDAPRQLSDSVLRTTYGTAVTLSPQGTLVSALPISPASRLVLGDLNGKRVPIGEARIFDSPRVSPDGRRIAVVIGEREGQDLWVGDRAFAAPTRVTRGGQGRIELQGWTADNRSLVYTGGQELWITPVDGSGDPRRLVRPEGRILSAALLPGDRSVILSRRVDGTGGTVDREELVRVSIGGDEVVPLLTSRSSGSMMRPTELRVSPDGRWVAFRDRNQAQVHIRSVDGAVGAQVSEAGGIRPVWGADSSRLYYHTSSGLMVADLQTSPSLAVVNRRRVTGVPPSSTLNEVSPDNQTFLFLEPVDSAPGVVVTMNWTAAVRRQLLGRDQ